MRCIECGQELETRIHEGVELTACPAGHGVWLDLGELKAIAMAESVPRPEGERAAELAAGPSGMAAVVSEASAGKRACPACGAGMRKVEYAGSSVVMDSCGEHGVWLDQGELERVEAFAEGFRRSVAQFG